MRILTYWYLLILHILDRRSYASVEIRASPESVLRAMPDLLLEMISCRKSWRLGGEPG